MKKALLVAVLVMASAPAWADRVVETEDRSGTKARACDFAKLDAQKELRPGEYVKGFSACQCEEETMYHWHCSVEATIAKDDGN